MTNIKFINVYKKNNINEIGDFPISTGDITNCSTTTAPASSTSISIPFIPEPPVIYPTVIVNGIKGCTNPKAVNWNPFATIDDGTCIVL